MSAQAGDLKLTTTTHSTLSNGQTTDYTQTLIIHDQRSRMLLSAFNSSAGVAKTPGANVAIIQQCDARQTLFVDYDNKVYSVHSLPGVFSKAQIEAALAKAKANPQPAPTETLTISNHVVDTNERKMAFGRVMRHYKIHSSWKASPGANTQSREEDADGWYVEIPEYDQLDGCSSFDGHKIKGSVRFANVINGDRPNYRIVTELSEAAAVGHPAQVKSMTTSFVKMPDKTERAYSTTSTETIAELSTAPLDPALFDVPHGFAKVAQVEMSSTPSWNYRAQIAWARFISMFSH